MNKNNNNLEEFNDLIESERIERTKNLESRLNEDEKIKKKMSNGKIGISHGSDKIVSFLMFIVTLIITLIALYVIFQVNPSHYEI